jgi:hypothetical protein
MNDNRPAYVKLYEKSQAAKERGDMKMAADLSYEAYKAKIQESNFPAIEVWGGKSQERERERER